MFDFQNLEVYKKAHNGSGKENDEYIKSVAKKRFHDEREQQSLNEVVAETRTMQGDLLAEMQAMRTQLK
jgi:hypothetical protein